jgi:hypothetical protein
VQEEVSHSRLDCGGSRAGGGNQEGDLIGRPGVPGKSAPGNPSSKAFGYHNIETVLEGEPTPK